VDIAERSGIIDVEESAHLALSRQVGNFNSDKQFERLLLGWTRGDLKEL
jgi:hypothetical protein